MWSNNSLWFQYVFPWWLVILCICQPSGCCLHDLFWGMFSKVLSPFLKKGSCPALGVLGLLVCFENLCQVCGLWIFLLYQQTFHSADCFLCCGLRFFSLLHPIWICLFPVLLRSWPGNKNEQNKTNNSQANFMSCFIPLFSLSGCIFSGFMSGNYHVLLVIFNVVRVECTVSFFCIWIFSISSAIVWPWLFCENQAAVSV